MGDIKIEVETGHINLSPHLFRRLARDYFKCYIDFQTDGRFSAVPFFLCCRAIELALKAMHLETKSQEAVKNLYRHDLVKSYRDLEPDQQTLQPQELALLTAANHIYDNKNFEYLSVYDAGAAYKEFPDLEQLGALAKKITEYDI